jgi:hypothetical protein
MAKDVKTKFENVGFAMQPRSSGTFDPPVADGSGASQWDNIPTLIGVGQYFPLHCIPGTVLPNRNANINNYMTTNSLTDYPTTGKIIANEGGVVPSLDMELLANPTTMVGFLLASMQEVTHTEPSAGVHKYVFTPNGSVLDFTDNEGYVFSVAGYRAGNTTDGYQIFSAILNTFSWSINNNAQDVERIAKMTAQWMGGGMLVNTPIVSLNASVLQDDLIGSVLDTDNEFTLDITTPSTGALTDVCWYDWAQNYNGGVTSDCFVGAGAVPNNLKRDGLENSFTVRMPYNTSTLTLLSDYASSNNIALRFRNQYTDSEVGHVDFNIANAIATAEPLGVNGNYFGIDLTVTPLVDETNLDNNTITVVAEDDFSVGF